MILVGRARMYARKREHDIAIQAKKKMHELGLQDKPESAPVSRDETKCQKCGFKATYKFIRCPSCDEVQK